LSIAAVDRRLETVARTLGGSHAWVFASITLPLALPGIVTGALLSFARSLGEFGATITFVSNIPGETETLPLAIYSAIQTSGSLGMQTMDAHLAQLVRTSRISRKLAEQRASVPEELKRLLGAAPGNGAVAPAMTGGG
jgi:molybdate transport system permease protein